MPVSRGVLDKLFETHKKEEEMKQKMKRLKVTMELTKRSVGCRVDYGGAGRTITVLTNFVPISKIPTKAYRYRVEFADLPPSLSLNSPPRQITSRKDKLRVLRGLSARSPFDHILWAPSHTCEFVYTLTYNPEGCRVENVSYSTRTGKNQVLDFVRLHFDGEIELSTDPTSIVGTEAQPDASDHEKLQVINALATRFALFNEKDLTQVGGSRFFLNSDITPCGEVLQIRRGYYLSARAAEESVLLNINATATCFFKPLNLAEVLRALLPKFGHNESYLSTLLEQLQVRITYSRGIRDRGGPNERDLDAEHERRKTIVGLGEPVGLQRFYTSADDKEGRAVVDYFRRDLGIEIRDGKLPCINVGSKTIRERAVYIPPELVTIVHDQTSHPKISEMYVSDIIKVAARPADKNRNLIAGEGLKTMGLAPNVLQGFGFDIGGELQQTPARILTPPIVQYGQGRAFINEASWNLVPIRQFIVTGKVQNLYVVVFNHVRLRYGQALGEVIERAIYGNDGLLAQCVSHGLRIRRDAVSVFYLNEGSWRKDLKDYFTKIAQNPSSLVFIVLPSTDSLRYNAVKRLADMETGVSTVSATFDKVASGNKQFWSNQALKLNIKSGGINHIVAPGTFQDIGCPLGNLIIMGADVVHLGGPDKLGCPSVACVVASTGTDFTNYLPSMRLQNSLQEKITDMQEMVKERIKVWLTKNPNKLPSAILFYRDAVGDSQLHWVQEEGEAILEAWKSVDELKEKPLRLSLIVVTKRHHVRAYPSSSQPTPDISRFGDNIKPGMVIDRTIVHPWAFDFFLQPHAAIKGTARPGHYRLLKNELQLSADVIQRVTHALCYSYGKATKGISLPAPAYLADLCCRRAKVYMSLYEVEHMPTRMHDETMERWYERCLWVYGLQYREWLQPHGPWHQNIGESMFYI